MRLTDLDPRWFAAEGRRGQGITFECPHCVGTPHAVRLSAPFKNPVDGGAPVSLEARELWPLLWPRPDNAPDRVTVPPGVCWDRTGETFEVLSLLPSIDASRSGHWHGFVRLGEIVNAGP